MDRQSLPVVSRRDTRFVFVAWCVWAIGPGLYMSGCFFDSGSGSEDEVLPFSVQASGGALIVLLLAAWRFEGWRYSEFWLLLAWFCLFSILALFGIGLPWPLASVNWAAFVTFCLVQVSALAMPVVAIVAGLNKYDEGLVGDL